MDEYNFAELAALAPVVRIHCIVGQERLGAVVATPHGLKLTIMDAGRPLSSADLERRAMLKAAGQTDAARSMDGTRFPIVADVAEALALTFHCTCSADPRHVDWQAITTALQRHRRTAAM
jgi:hypothetical protein